MKKRTFSLLLISVLTINLFGCSTSSNSTKIMATTSQTDTSEEGNINEVEPKQNSINKASSYESTLFDTSYVHDINVEIADLDWSDLLENPTAKTKYTADVTVDGTLVGNVTFATKGNTSLTQVAATDSNRYSFKINFGKHVEGQTYDGLDKLNLNNAYSDATYLKDYISYRIMNETGVAAPLVNFVYLSINGDYYGLYIGIEEVGDSFLTRNYGEDAGQLYKPETDQLAQMPANFDSDDKKPDLENFEEREFEKPSGDFGGESKGADLAYIDDEISSYSDIFDNAETKADETDYKRVIAALKQLSTGQDLDHSIDIEAVLRYFAAHNFITNFDSYTGNLLHNYYLYEDDGLLTMLPWDYNLAYGGFNMPFNESDEIDESNSSATEATELVNWPIDTPLDNEIEAETRPMWNQLITNDNYLVQYHSYIDQLLVNYLENGRLKQELIHYQH